MGNPYAGLPPTAFWRPAVADRSVFDIDYAWKPTFAIGAGSPIATFGSCFAASFGPALIARSFSWIDGEPAPPGLSEERARQYGYRTFSCRTGNIYTTTMLLQWVNWAAGGTPPAEVWRDEDGGYRDPFRPRIEPRGFASEGELRDSRDYTVERFGAVIRQAEVFVFTLGLTERWASVDGYEYALCPGTVAGDFDPDRHRFRNLTAAQVAEALRGAICGMRRLNPALKFLLTVSPVPLTATASGKQVLVANTYSKSVLRAVAGELADEDDSVDYFPSYEIVTAPTSNGVFYEANRRSVTKRAVHLVMDVLFASLGCDARSDGEAPLRPPATPAEEESEEDDVCDEAILGAFGPQERDR